MKYVSLFAGIGGFDLALDRLGHKCVYVNEWDKYAAAIYENNFKHRPDTTDITRVDARSIPDHELLVGGFPCQSFSIAGKRAGFDDTRGTLFFDIARIIKEKRTKYLLLENVKGLLSHDSGRTFKTIIATLDGLGYDCQWQVLNSKNFGVPQNRERVFIVANLRGEPAPQIFPITADDRKDAAIDQEGGAPQNQITDTLTVHYAKNQHGSQYVVEENDQDRRFKIGTYRTHKDGQGFREMKEGIAPTIPARAREDGSGQAVIMQGCALRTRKYAGKEAAIEVRGDEVSNALNTQKKDYMVTDSVRIRRLTPVECERLQGFPDDYTKFGAMGGGIQEISDTQRYKTLGNAVTVNVVYEVAKRAFENLIQN